MIKGKLQALGKVELIQREKATFLLTGKARRFL
jgi:hypothetical protein